MADVTRVILWHEGVRTAPKSGAVACESRLVVQATAQDREESASERRQA